ncbi:putative protease [Haloferax prahovense DSM 18310]|uniref:Protease n=1 Tax=Haloferax prahovense (strain DSM 18310 / JCM 13924 / TL6) TaxID=1227461 RepID=M0G1A0_HALPT|nr:CPBP family intramembrane glutamic endopeptidase [Haloferax prahovense]ELZ65970.1 putative protease [Haloferax prahovense DSM 18310]
MVRTRLTSPTFDRSASIPTVTYVLLITVLSGFLLAAPHGSPTPLLGLAWSGVLVALAAGALRVEGVALQSLFPSLRAFGAAVAVVVAFWALYNLVAAGLATAGVGGFEPVLSRVVAHPAPYLAALLSSFVLTALPEELLFRGYFQQKAISLAGGDSRRAVIGGVAAVAVLFAVFHLPRWFIASGHGVSAALGTRLFGLLLAGLVYGGVYAFTGNLWVVALFHATMNQPPFIVTVDIPAELHLVAGVVEYAGILAVVVLAVRLTGIGEGIPVWARE